MELADSLITMEDHAKVVKSARLEDYGRTFHKRFGVFSFGEGGLQHVEFIDVNPFDNSHIVYHATGSPLLQLSIKDVHGTNRSGSKDPHELSSFFFNGHLLCDWNDPWRPRAADSLVGMLSHISDIGTAKLIVNPRDFPWCKKNQSVPWTFLKAWLPDKFFNVPMQRPLSFYGGPEWLDVLMPLPEHWRVWEETRPLRLIHKRSDIPMGVFRGTLTGRFVDERNVRIQLGSLSCQHPALLDAKLSGWTNRYRVSGCRDGVLYAEEPSVPEHRLLGVSLSKEEQSMFRVIVYAPGHVASSRLAWNLCSGSAVLMVRDPSCVAPDMWFTTAEFDARIASFVDGKFVTNASTIAFACHAKDVLQALDVLRLDADLLVSVTRCCLQWAETTFAAEAVKAALKKACKKAADL
jgi:hypothetical protein